LRHIHKQNRLYAKPSEVSVERLSPYQGIKFFGLFLVLEEAVSPLLIIFWGAFWVADFCFCVCTSLPHGYGAFRKQNNKKLLIRYCIKPHCIINI
jgi:hypothetical protein